VEYSTVVGDLAGDVTNADLMNVFRTHNLDLQGDSPSGSSSPSHSCCNAKSMVGRMELKGKKDGDGRGRGRGRGATGETGETRETGPVSATAVEASNRGGGRHNCVGQNGSGNNRGSG